MIHICMLEIENTCIILFKLHYFDKYDARQSLPYFFHYSSSLFVYLAMIFHLIISIW